MNRKYRPLNRPPNKKPAVNFLLNSGLKSVWLPDQGIPIPKSLTISE